MSSNKENFVLIFFLFQFSFHLFVTSYTNLNLVFEKQWNYNDLTDTVIFGFYNKAKVRNDVIIKQ